MFAPAVSCPEPGGLHPQAIHNVLETMSDLELMQLQAFEIVEYNPCISTHTEEQRDITFNTLSTLIYVVVERLRNLARLEAQA
jgi:arginase family enzyme